MEHKRLNRRRKFLLSLASLSVGGLFLGVKGLSNHFAKQTQKPAPKPNARLGINLSGIAYWASEFPFVDLMHQSGEWVSQPVSGDWGAGPQLMLDAHGWVKALAKDCRATKIICAGDDVEYPNGTYVILYDGEGEVTLNSPNGKIKKTKMGRLEVDIDANQDMFAIDIISTNPKNYIRNIRVIAPGFEATYQANPWHPDFLKRWSGVACIRLMDMMATNNSSQVNWQDRPKLKDASFAEKGVPVELLVDLANRLDTDAWFCMPHQANNAYIKQFAMAVKNKLKPNLFAWVEYSNEVWNGGFEQHRYAGKQGQRLNLANNEWKGSFHYNAYRSVEIFKIWQTVFVRRERFISVIASHAANVHLSDQLLSLNEVAVFADVLAIAPYVSLNVPPKDDGNGLAANKVARWSLDKLFDYLNKVALPESETWVTENKKVADAKGIKLVAYEAGQHLVGVAGAENNEQLTDLLIKANADMRMGKVYTKYLHHWQQAGGDVMCLYNSMGGWSQWGSWGLLQHAKDSASPKFKAAIDWARSRGQKIND